MDPEELQEVGLFLLLGMVWAMMMRSNSGRLEPLVNVIMGALFAAGIGLVVYGAVLVRREGRLILKNNGTKKGG